MEKKIINTRCSPLPLEFYMPKNGKRFLDASTARAMQSKISLKFPLSSDVKGKGKLKQDIK